MAKASIPRSGSLQFWPRKRARKFLPSVNWKAFSKVADIEEGLLGFIVYKVGMASAIVKDNTENSLSKGKRIAIPVTILEAPILKIFSLRFYRKGIVKREILNRNLDKHLKKRVRLSKIDKRDSLKDLENIRKDLENYDDIRVIVYSDISKTGIKKSPDLVEVGLAGSIEKKYEFLMSNLDKEISISEVFDKDSLVDVRGLTKGKGLSGPVKRFGIGLKDHKSEKGRRKPGSIGPWHPARVTFRVPMAGQLGMFTRICYNIKIVDIGKIRDKDINPRSGFHKFGNIKTEYVILGGSALGTPKRQLLLTFALRPAKKQKKKNFELLGLR